ncbi:unnamed protein product [Urochloa humidicola]
MGVTVSLAAGAGKRPGEVQSCPPHAKSRESSRGRYAPRGAGLASGRCSPPLDTAAAAGGLELDTTTAAGGMELDTDAAAAARRLCSNLHEEGEEEACAWESSSARKCRA